MQCQRLVEGTTLNIIEDNAYRWIWQQITNKGP